MERLTFDLCFLPDNNRRNPDLGQGNGENYPQLDADGLRRPPVLGLIDERHRLGGDAGAGQRLGQHGHQGQLAPSWPSSMTTCAAASSSAVWYFISPQTTASTPAATSAGARLPRRARGRDDPAHRSVRRAHTRGAPEPPCSEPPGAPRSRGLAVAVGHLADLPVAPCAANLKGSAKRRVNLSPSIPGSTRRRRAHIERRVEIHERHLVADGGPHHGARLSRALASGAKPSGPRETPDDGWKHVGPSLGQPRPRQPAWRPGPRQATRVTGSERSPTRSPVRSLLGILGRELLQQRLLQAADGHVERTRREMGLAYAWKESLSAGLVGLVEQSHMISFFLGTEPARPIADAPYSMVMLRRSPVAVGTVTLPARLVRARRRARCPGPR